MTRPLRADASRNRDKLLSAAGHEFATQGLDAPLEHIAKRAGVSIGTLYNHFPTRDDFLNALLPERVGPALEELTVAALADDDPWRAFENYLTGMCALQATDQALNDTIAQRIPLTPEVRAVCSRGQDGALRIIARARAAGRLRPDFEPADLVTLYQAMAEVIRCRPDGWRRFLAVHLDGLRAGHG